MRLYEIIGELAAIDSALEETGELTPELEAKLDALEQAREDKLVGLAQMIRNCEADVAAVKEEEKRLKALKKSIESRLESLKGYTVKCLNGGKVSAGTFRLSTRKAEALEVEDFEAVPAQFRRVKYVEEVDKDVAKQTLKEGGEVPGCKIVVREHLQIK